ncbi:MAG: TIR domain-containing protein [Bacteroidetes bacterium]|nr:TIR domain-containing protein [Bacteroidota bacterium]
MVYPRSGSVLYLSYNQISDNSFLEKLTSLQELDLGYNQISDISFLEKLACLPLLTNLHLSNNPIQDIPKEIIENFNCIQGIRDHFRALKKGMKRNNEAKLILLGNGRVGKTSLVKAMLDREFTEHVSSTDKISLRSWEILDEYGDILKDGPFHINIWDFGGQEIYYTTHKLFLRTKALFLLVWDKETEENSIHDDGYGHTFENFRLLHWIDYIKTAATQSPVIVVQNKVDSREERDSSHEMLLKEHYDPIIDYQYVSAKEQHQKGVPELQKSIHYAYRTIKEIWQPIGIQWLAVKERLLDLPEKRISYREYEEICKDEELEDTEPSTLLKLLHDTGFLYYLKEVEDRQIILDQKWAIDSVYAIFERSNKCYNILCKKNLHGFELVDLDILVWGKDYSEDEQKALLRFMVSAEVCFEYTEGVYIAPQLLSKKFPQRVYQREEWKNPIDPAIKFKYKFLHHAIIERFIVRTGLMVREEDPAIWRNGIAIYDPVCSTDALVEAFPEKEEIQVLTRGNNPYILLKKVIDELTDLHNDYDPEVFYSTDGGNHFVSKAEIEDKIQSDAKKVKDEDESYIELSPFLPFIEMEKKSFFSDRKVITSSTPFKTAETSTTHKKTLKKTRPSPEKPVIKCFISYAHAYQEYYEVFLEDFDSFTNNLPFGQLDIWSDERIELGENWHESIQEEVAKCDIAILLVSDRFMSSDYIKKEEVEKLFSRKEKSEYLIVPIYFNTCRFYDWPELEKHQLFKPKGANYGCPEKDKNNKFCYAHLVQFDSVKGVKLPNYNSNRLEYMDDLVRKLEAPLKEIVAKK